MNLKRAATIVTTGGGLAAWLFGAATSNHTAAPPPPNNRVTPIERRGAELATEVARFHDHVSPSAAPRQPGRNLFKFREAPSHAPAAAAVPALVPESAPAPPPLPPMRLIGISEDSGPNGPVRTVYITGDGQLFSAKEGDTVMARYKVTKISADVVELTDNEDGTVRRLALR